MKEKIMNVNVAPRHVTRADGNIFLDLGFPPDEAAKMLAETDREIAEERRKKSADSKIDRIAHH